MTERDKIYLQRTLRIEEKFIPLIRKAIEAYRSSFIDTYRREGKANALQNLPPFSEHIAPIIQDIYRTAGLFGGRFGQTDIYAQLSRRDRQYIASKKSVKSFGFAEEWVNDILAFLRLHLVETIANITDTMRQDIVNILERSFQNSWGIDQTIEALQDRGLMEARAKVIARTEVIRAANVGHQVAASKTPFEVDKKWSAAGDSRTRNSHRAVNGHITDEVGTFRVPVYKGDKLIGFEEMQRPGDPNASASNTINCRCRAVFIPKRDTQGNIILRRSNSATIIPMRNPVTGIPAHQIAAILKANAVVKIDPEGKG